MALGLIFYGLGWWLLVGFDWNPDQPWRARQAAVWYLLAGLAALVLSLLALLAGVVTVI
ncbi:MAG: hypothetical protein HC915_13405 [Anaerolineae bacterium]|nr:hypothetical protein [Anaerolineae bacterium]